MAWLVKKKSGIYHLGFRFGGDEITRSLKTRHERTAQAALHRIEETILLVERGRLEIPEEADVGTFMFSDGKIERPIQACVRSERLTLGKLFERYSAALPENSIAAESLRVAEIHMRHIARILGTSRNLRDINAELLQKYVSKRCSESGKRGRTISSGTVKKELATFRTLYRWAKRFDYVTQDFPNQGLRYPIERAKPPFQTWRQIEVQISASDLSEPEIAELWASVYLDTQQIAELLDTVKTGTEYGFLHPMSVFAAHTGARRSELCRSQEADFDFDQRLIRIREKKKQQGRLTFRHVPMSSMLRNAMQRWFAIKDKSPYSFPAEHKVTRRRNNNRRDELGSVSPDEATDHLQQTLSTTKFECLPGWHVFRHSFISNLCSRGVDQRFIDSFVGHQTDEMRDRYRHLFPSSMQAALTSVFD